MSAAQRVCAIPELGSMIIELTASSVGSDPQATIYSCARVNHLWFWEAMRYLWSNINWQKLRALKSMPIERRQVYAGFVKALSLDGHPSSKYQTQILDGLLFPRVQSVNIRLWDHLTRFYLPPIQAPALRVLDLNVYKVEMTNGHILYDGSVEKRFAELCKEMFPNLQKVILRNGTQPSAISPAELQTFAANFGDIEIVFVPARF